MHSLFKGLLVIFGLVAASCSPFSRCPTASPEKAKEAQEALADFAVGLFRNVTARDEDKNQVLSPLSIAIGLALLESGADGKTRDDLKRTLLEVGASRDNVIDVYVNLQEQLKIDQDKVKLTIANGLFQDKELKLKDDYVNAIKSCYKSDVQQVDFQDQLEQTRQRVNQYIAGKTSQKIPELFKKGDLNSDDRLILANAIYFKASWATSFSEHQTKQDTFYRNGRDQDKQTVKFLQGKINLRHASTRDVDALELPYDHRDLAMYVVLPKSRDGIRDLEQRLTGKQLREIIGDLEQKQVNVQLPKFSVRSQLSLKDTLRRMGLDSIFSQKADFSRMSETPLKVDNGVHEAYLTVDENGTEGAAATGFAVMNRALPMAPPEETSFKADHPFLYVVLHKETGAIIFLGKISSVEQRE